MAKKTKKKSQNVTRSELHIVGLDAPLLLREGYATVKRRVYDGMQFMEVTSSNGRKLTVNKGIVNMIYPVE